MFPLIVQAWREFDAKVGTLAAGMEFQAGAARVEVNVPSRAALLDEIAARFARGDGFALATLNLDHLVKLSRDPAFAAAYRAHDLVSADGRPIVGLARLAGYRIELVTGSDLIRPLLQQAAGAGIPVALFGATTHTLKTAARRLMADIPGLEIALTIAPPMGFDPDGAEAEAALVRLREAGIRLCLIALGAPRQERFAAFGRMVAPEIGFVSIGAGLDFIAGTQRRAPAWLRAIALEWLWRLLSDPRRLALRYLQSALILPGHVMRALRMRRQG